MNMGMFHIPKCYSFNDKLSLEHMMVRYVPPDDDYIDRTYSLVN